MQQRNLKGALISIFIIEALGILSSFFTGNIRAIYKSLIKPPYSPPSWLFSLIWFFLYALMGLAIYRIYTSLALQRDKREAIKLFTYQLVTNLLWALIFFRLELFWIAIIVILALDILLFLTIRCFWDLDETASVLLMPYLLWVLFATYLNIGFALLN